jgi:hypothetical protein
MYRLRETLRRRYPGLLALALLAVLPGLAHAGEMGFRNDLKVPIIVQGQSIVNKTVRRGPALLIPSGKTAWDTNIMAGVRVVTIYYANQTTRILGQFTIPYDGNDAYYAVVAAPVPPGAPPRVQLLKLPLP